MINTKVEFISTPMVITVEDFAEIYKNLGYVEIHRCTGTCIVYYPNLRTIHILQDAMHTREKYENIDDMYARIRDLVSQYYPQSRAA